MIPHEKIAAVTRGLREAFGVTEFEDVRALTGGLTSALVFRIVVRGEPFLLRTITRTDAMSNPARLFTCMRSAAEAGLAPRVRYTSVEDRISITDFVEIVPFSKTEALARMPVVMRTLHSLPPFPTAMNYETVSKGFIHRFQSANMLPQNEIEEGFARYAQVVAVYPRRDQDIVSCHNDLKPENILFDGERVWLADWEAAMRNDRYFDLAIVANFVVTNDAEGKVYLRNYFGQEPDEYQLARFFLMQQVMHMFYAAMFLYLGSAGKAVDLSERAPEFRAFHNRIWEGEIDLHDNVMKILYGRVHWARLLENTRLARFQEALKIVRNDGGEALLLENG